MLLMKSPMRTMITVELPYSVSVTHTSVTRLHVTCYKLHVTRYMMHVTRSGTHRPHNPVALSAMTMYGDRHCKCNTCPTCYT